MLKCIRSWYHGKGEIHEFENSPDSSIVIWPIFYKSYHWSARAARAPVAFYLRNWQWVWTAAIGILGLYVAVQVRK